LLRGRCKLKKKSAGGDGNGRKMAAGEYRDGVLISYREWGRDGKLIESPTWDEKGFPIE